VDGDEVGFADSPGNFFSVVVKSCYMAEKRVGSFL